VGQVDHTRRKVNSDHSRRTSLGKSETVAPRATADIQNALASQRLQTSQCEIEAAAHNATPHVVYPTADYPFVLGIDSVEPASIGMEMTEDLLFNTHEGPPPWVRS